MGREKVESARVRAGITALWYGQCHSLAPLGLSLTSGWPTATLLEQGSFSGRWGPSRYLNLNRNPGPQRPESHVVRLPHDVADHPTVTPALERRRLDSGGAARED